MRFQELAASAGSLRLAIDIYRGSDKALIPDIPMSAPATTDANTAETVSTADKTTVE